MKLSKMLVPLQKEKSRSAESVSHDLSLRAGLIQQVSAGVYSILPLGQKVLHRIEDIVRKGMEDADAQEVTMPIVQPADLWKESDRWNVYGKEMLRFLNRDGREFCLAPTHEEVTSDILRVNLKSYKQLPITLFQIGRKYRDEMRPRNGFLRSREFIMKDAYSFDLDSEGLDRNYLIIRDTYMKIFSKMGLTAYPVSADTGEIGGHGSEEFMVPASIGEDKINIVGENAYKSSENDSQGVTAIEVGHIFKLGDKYSKSMNVTYTDKNGEVKYPMMGCYGIGVTRLLSAIIEQHHDDRGIVWPENVAPFKVEVIPLDNSELIADVANNLYFQFKSNNIEVLLDDRQVTPGFKFNDANLMGIPYRVIIGKKSIAKNEVEIESRNTMKGFSVNSNDVLNTYLNLSKR